MTVSISRKAFISGLPADRVVKCLREARWRSLDGSVFTSFGATCYASLAIQDQLFKQGLLELHNCDSSEEADLGTRRAMLALSRCGKAVASASLKQRIPRKRALAVLDRIVERAVALGASGRSPIVATRIWQFGSTLLEGNDLVGDLDLVIEHRHTGILGKDHSPTRDYEYILREFPGILRHDFDLDTSAEHPNFAFFFRYLYGGNRPSAVARSDISDLIALGCPCRLVYDEARGGKVDGPILPIHPESKGRDAKIRPQVRTPVLSEQWLGPEPIHPSVVQAGWPFYKMPDIQVLPQADGMIALAGGGTELLLRRQMFVSNDAIASLIFVSGSTGASLSASQEIFEFLHRLSANEIFNVASSEGPHSTKKLVGSVMVPGRLMHISLQALSFADPTIALSKTTMGRALHSVSEIDAQGNVITSVGRSF